MGKFRLAVGAQVFIAKTAGNLVIAVHAGHHQQLLKQLRGLRQGIKLARLDACRHQKIARALGRGLGEHRRFNVEKIALIQVVAQGAGQAGTQANVVLHLRAAQIQVAVSKANGFTGFFVQHKRQRLGRVEHFVVIHHHFDGACA